MPHDPERIDPAALEVLHDAGFVWDPKLSTWFNVKVRRAIGFETVRDNSLEWLRGWLQCATAGPEGPARRDKR